MARTFVFDLDGVVYRGEQALPEAVDTIEILRRLGHQVYFFTNNSSKSRSSYLRKLRRMGINTDVAHVMTSGYVTALYLKDRAPGSSVFAVGEAGLKGDLWEAGMKLVEDSHADYVVVGIDRSFGYDTLVKAQHAILSGAKFIATNPDTTYPLEHGRIVPGNGALVAAVQAASGATPVMIGKPEPEGILEILKLAKSNPADAVIVGDRLDTDILAGKRIGATTVLVLTGVTSESDLRTAPEEMRPDIVVQTLTEMPEKLGIADE